MKPKLSSHYTHTHTHTFEKKIPNNKTAQQIANRKNKQKTQNKLFQANKGHLQNTIKQGRPRGSGWRGRWEGESGWGTHVNPWLFHFNV